MNIRVNTHKYQQKADFLGDELPVMVKETGPNIDDWRPSLHCHDELEFQLVCQGRCQYFIHDTNYTLAPGFLAMIHPDEIHTFVPFPIGKTTLRKIAVVFPQSIFKDRPHVLDIISRLKDVHCLLLPAKQLTIIELLFMEIIEEYKARRAYWQQIICDCIVKFLTIILRLVDEGINTQLVETDEMMQEVISYLDQHFKEHQSLISVAAIFGMSQFYLSRRFKEYTGLGFRDYIINRRIVESKRLLEKTNLKITAVAYQVGFEDVSTFYRDFRLATGISPAAYRKISE